MSNHNSEGLAAIGWEGLAWNYAPDKQRWTATLRCEVLLLNIFIFHWWDGPPHWPLTVWRYMVKCLQRYDFFFRFYVSTNQFPGNKRMINSPLPDSWSLNPEAMNDDLELIIKQIKHCIQISFFHIKYFYRVWIYKAKAGY